MCPTSRTTHLGGTPLESGEAGGHIKKATWVSAHEAALRGLPEAVRGDQVLAHALGPRSTVMAGPVGGHPFVTNGYSLILSSKESKALFPDLCHPRARKSGIEVENPPVGLSLAEPLFHSFPAVVGRELNVNVADCIAARIRDARHAIVAFAFAAKMDLSAGLPDGQPLREGQRERYPTAFCAVLLLSIGPGQAALLVGLNFFQGHPIHGDTVSIPFGSEGRFFLTRPNFLPAILGAYSDAEQKLPNALTSNSEVRSDSLKSAALAVHERHLVDTLHSFFASLLRGKAASFRDVASLAVANSGCGGDLPQGFAFSNQMKDQCDDGGFWLGLATNGYSTQISGALYRLPAYAVMQCQLFAGFALSNQLGKADKGVMRGHCSGRLLELVHAKNSIKTAGVSLEEPIGQLLDLKLAGVRDDPGPDPVADGALIAAQRTSRQLLIAVEAGNLFRGHGEIMALAIWLLP